MDSQFENSIPTIKITNINFMDNIHVSKYLNFNEKDKEISSKKYISQIYKDTIGNDYIMKSPFGFDNFLIYCDYTASGRGLNSLENFIKNKVLTSYANLHSTVGFCSEKTSKLSRESKDILRDYCNAWGNFSLIYHGQGCTGAIYKCIDLLNIKHYVNFYETLESLAKIHNTLFKGNKDEGIELKKKKMQYEIMTRDLRRKIDKYYRLFFFKCNFCSKIKTFDNNIFKCLLCKDEKGDNLHFDSEGTYHSHEKTKIHIKNRKEFYKNPKKNLFNSENDPKEYSNFLDEIRENYKITEEKVDWKRLQTHYEEEESKLHYLYDLIRDYKRFKPVVFVSVYEHNSNKLSWIETQAEVVTINNLDELHSKLISEDYKNRYIKIGSFTAASNITGLLLDVDAFSIEMHKSGGLVFFDYASGAPYLQINVNGKLPDDYRKKLNFTKKFSKEDIDKYCYKDGIFFSPHKFIGGPNTPGVLIIHNRITMNTLKPTQAGGGTVNYVLKGNINYSLDVEVKEESGTPNIIGGIRIGLMTFIRSKIDHNLIIDIDDEYNKLMDNIDEPNIYILENELLNGKPHIPVFSFMISYGDKFYHPNYICALLNDLFGIQSRPGCSCAPDYGQLLLKKKFDNFEQFKDFILEGNEIFKPGYTRLNLPYFYPKYVIEYIIKAIKFICQHAQLFIGLYNYDIKSGKFFFYDTKKLPQITKISTMFKFENDYENNNTDIFKSSFIDTDINNIYSQTKYIKNIDINNDENNEKTPDDNNSKKKSNEIIEDTAINPLTNIETDKGDDKKNKEFTFRKKSEINGEISKEKLNNILTRVEDYCCSSLLFDNLKQAESEIQPEIRINELGSIDKFRWFLLYKDVKEEIQKLKEMDENNEYSILDSQMNDKRNRIVEFNWSFKK